MAATTTAHELSTDAGCQALYKSKGRNLRRDDFPATPEGWQMWCDHRIRKHAKEASVAAVNQKYWESVRAGEHMQEAAAKVEQLQKALAEAEQLKKELADLKAKQEATASKEVKK